MVHLHALLVSKAAEVVSLVSVMLDLLKRWDNNSDHHGHRIMAFHYLDSIYSIILQSGPFLDDVTYMSLRESADLFLEHYDWLCKNALAAGQRRYNITFKTHAFWHLIDLAKYLNPRALWAYAFEDYMGKLVKSAKRCSAGTKANLVGRKVLENVLLALRLEIEAPLRLL